MLPLQPWHRIELFRTANNLGWFVLLKINWREREPKREPRSPSNSIQWFRKPHSRSRPRNFILGTNKSTKKKSKSSPDPQLRCLVRYLTQNMTAVKAIFSNIFIFFFHVKYRSLTFQAPAGLIKRSEKLSGGTWDKSDKIKWDNQTKKKEQLTNQGWRACIGFMFFMTHVHVHVHVNLF